MAGRTVESRSTQVGGSRETSVGAVATSGADLAVEDGRLAGVGVEGTVGARKRHGRVQGAVETSGADITGDTVSGIGDLSGVGAVVAGITNTSGFTESSGLTVRTRSAVDGSGGLSRAEILGLTSGGGGSRNSVSSRAVVSGVARPSGSGGGDFTVETRSAGNAGS